MNHPRFEMELVTTYYTLCNRFLIPNHYMVKEKEQVQHLGF